MKYFYCILILIISSCSVNKKEVSLKKSNHVIEKAGSLKEEVSIQKLMLLTKEEAVAKYEKASFIERFTLADAYGEFRNNITNQYIQEERVSKTIIIDEVTWEKDKETWITVWYEVQESKSIPKAVYVWEKGTEF